MTKSTAVLVEFGFMVLVGLRGLRSFRTKKAPTTEPSPPGQPRAGKVKPKNVPTIHEGASVKAVLTGKSVAGEQLKRRYSVGRGNGLSPGL